MSAALIRSTMRSRCTISFYVYGGQCRGTPMGVARRNISFSATAGAYVGQFGTSIISRM